MCRQLGFPGGWDVQVPGGRVDTQATAPLELPGQGGRQGRKDAGGVRVEERGVRLQHGILRDREAKWTIWQGRTIVFKTHEVCLLSVKEEKPALENCAYCGY